MLCFDIFFYEFNLYIFQFLLLFSRGCGIGVLCYPLRRLREMCIRLSYDAVIKMEEIWLAHVKLIIPLKDHHVVDCTINGA